VTADRATRAKLIAAEAGIPADSHADVLDALNLIFEVHARAASHRTAEAEALQGVIGAAKKAGTTKRWREKLEQRAAALPLGLRFSIFEYQGYRDGKQLADELPAETILARARNLQAHIKRGRGRPRSELAAPLFSLLTLFEPFFPDGITRSGWSADAHGREYRYTGKLLDLVQALLEVEGIQHTRLAIGYELWKFAQQNERIEQRHASGKCATCDRPLPDPRDPEQYFCDACAGRVGDSPERSN
jgi:hypothetical protein